VTLNEATEIFNKEARQIARESMRAGKPVNSPENRARLDRLSQELARSMRKPPPGRTHMTRQMHQRMTNMARGAQMNPQEFKQMMRDLKRGYKIGQSPRGPRGPTGFGPWRNVSRLRAPGSAEAVGLAGYAGFKGAQHLLEAPWIGEDWPILGAHKRVRRAQRQSETLDAYNALLRQQVQGMPDDWYVRMSREMLLSDEEGYEPDPVAIESIVGSMGNVQFYDPSVEAPYDGLDDPERFDRELESERVGLLFPRMRNLRRLESSFEEETPQGETVPPNELLPIPPELEEEGFLQQHGFLDAGQFLEYWGNEQENYGITDDELLLGERLEKPTIEGLHIRINKPPGE